MISSKITKNEYLAATFGAFAMFMGAYFLVITGVCVCVYMPAYEVEIYPPPFFFYYILYRTITIHCFVQLEIF